MIDENELASKISFFSALLFLLDYIDTVWLLKLDSNGSSPFIFQDE